MGFRHAIIFIPLLTIITVLIFAIPGFFLGVHPALLFCGFILIGTGFQFAFTPFQAIPQELLKYRVEREEIENILEKAVSESSKNSLQAFIDKILPSDEIWYWESPEESWTAMRGRAGYVILRQGKATRHYVITGMN